MSIRQIYVLIVASVVAIFCIDGATASNERRVALVIGNADYTNFSVLANPRNDTALIERALKAAKFDDVRLVTNLNFVEMSKALQDFSVVAANADIAIVYYAGHGVEVGGTNYLVPVNAKLLRSTDVSYEGVSLELARTSVSGAKKLRMVILDACRNNPFKLTGLDGNRAVRRGLRAVETNSSELIAYSAKEGTFAQDGPADGNSPFAKALAKAITEEGLEVRRLFGKVRDEVLATTSKEQEPFVYSSIGGDELFLNPPKPTNPIQPIEVPEVQTEEIETAWQITKTEGSLEAFEGFKTLFSKNRLYKLYEPRVERQLNEFRRLANVAPVYTDQQKPEVPNVLSAKPKPTMEPGNLPVKKVTKNPPAKNIQPAKRRVLKKRPIEASIPDESTSSKKRKTSGVIAPKQASPNKSKASKACFDPERPWMHAFRPRCK